MGWVEVWEPAVGAVWPPGSRVLATRAGVTLGLSFRKGKEVPPSFKQFFGSSLALTHINLSGTKLSPEPLK